MNRTVQDEKSELKALFSAAFSSSVAELIGTAITLKVGRVEQRNFDGYTPPYIADAPVTVDVHIVRSAEV